jgi:hypothetical protein
LPRSIRTIAGKLPIGPYGSSTQIEDRNAASTLPRFGTPAVTASPGTALVAVSTNQVTQGLTSRPSTSTSTGASTWSASHA